MNDKVITLPCRRQQQQDHHEHSPSAAVPRPRGPTEGVARSPGRPHLVGPLLLFLQPRLLLRRRLLLPGEAEPCRVVFDTLAVEGLRAVTLTAGQLGGLSLALQDGQAVVAPEAAPARG